MAPLNRTGQNLSGFPRTTVLCCQYLRRRRQQISRSSKALTPKKDPSSHPPMRLLMFESIHLVTWFARWYICSFLFEDGRRRRDRLKFWTVDTLEDILTVGIQSGFMHFNLQTYRILHTSSSSVLSFIYWWWPWTWTLRTVRSIALFETVLCTKKLDKSNIHLINMSLLKSCNFKMAFRWAMNFLIKRVQFQLRTGKLDTLDLLAELLIALVSWLD